MNATTEVPVAETQDPLLFTDNAANKVKQLIEEEDNADLKLRVFVSGGGCSGFQYGFTFEEEVNEDDTVMTKNGVQLADRPYEFPVSCRGGNRLPGRCGRIAVHYQKPERNDYLRLRFIVLGLTGSGINPLILIWCSGRNS